MRLTLLPKRQTDTAESDAREKRLRSLADELQRATLDLDAQLKALREAEPE